MEDDDKLILGSRHDGLGIKGTASIELLISELCQQTSIIGRKTRRSSPCQKTQFFTWRYVLPILVPKSAHTKVGRRKPSTNLWIGFEGEVGIREFDMLLGIAPISQPMRWGVNPYLSAPFGIHHACMHSQVL